MDFDFNNIRIFLIIVGCYTEVKSNTTPSSKSENWFKKYANKRMLTSDYIDIIETTKMRCLAECSRRAFCNSVNYYTMTDICELLPYYFIEKHTSVTTETGWIHLSKVPCEQFTLYSRDDWGGGSGASLSYKPSIDWVEIHSLGPKREGNWPGDCGDVENCFQMMRDLRSYDQTEKGWSDIGENFYVDYSGNIYEGRGWRSRSAYIEQTIHGLSSGSDNGGAVHITILGQHVNEYPTVAQMESLRAFSACSVEQNKIPMTYQVIPHKDDYPISYQCPGNILQAIVYDWPILM